MTRWIAWAVIAGLATGLSHASATSKPTKLPDASAGRAVFDGRAHPRRDIPRYDIARYAPRPDPHYYARPVYYRPYPYAVPVPFVFGYGPFW